MGPHPDGPLRWEHQVSDPGPSRSSRSRHRWQRAGLWKSPARPVVDGKEIVCAAAGEGASSPGAGPLQPRFLSPKLPHQGPSMVARLGELEGHPAWGQPPLLWPHRLPLLRAKTQPAPTAL